MARALVVVVLFARVAAADSREDLQTRGEQAARSGNFSAAIVDFKAADKLEPRASHACLIALAYTRLERWPQAEVFLDLCHKRATPSDPLPDWVEEADAELVKKLAAAEVAPVTIEVSAPDAHITVSAFAPDEVFGPRTIHLAFGSHVITANAPGYIEQQQSVRITDRSAQTVKFTLVPVVPPPPPPPPPSKVPWIVIGAGGALLATAVVYNAIPYKTARDHLEHASDPAHPNPAEYAQYEATYDGRRRVMFGLYAAATATIITGIVLRVRDRRERSIQVSAQPVSGGALAIIEWSR